MLNEYGPMSFLLVLRMSLVCVCLLPWVAAHGKSSTLTLHLRDQVMTPPGLVRLADVVMLSGASYSDLRRLQATVLGRIVADDAPRAWSRQDIERRLDTGMPSVRRDVRWTGATEVRVIPANQIVAMKDISACAISTLSDWLSTSFEDFSVEPAQQLHEVRMPPGRLTLRARPLSTGTLPITKMTVWVDLLVDDQVSRTVAVPFVVQAHAAVHIARRDLQPQPGLSIEDGVSTIRIDVARLGVRPWHGDLSTISLRKPLLAGQVLTMAHVSGRSAIARGSRVELRSASGDVEIGAEVEAMQDGQVGDWIPVRLSRATGSVLARVLAPGLVGFSP